MFSVVLQNSTPWNTHLESHKAPGCKSNFNQKIARAQKYLHDITTMTVCVHLAIQSTQAAQFSFLTPVCPSILHSRFCLIHSHYISKGIHLFKATALQVQKINYLQGTTQQFQCTKFYSWTKIYLSAEYLIRCLCTHLLLSISL